MTTKAGLPGPGERFGAYRIVRRLGEGAMGVVFEAVDTALGRSVALKVLSSSIDEHEDFRARFRAEAQGQASLDSPHVVPVFAHGEVEGRLYIASQLVRGGDLGALITRHGPPPMRTAVDLVAQIADGLGDAHDGGVIHRDLKPSNVLLRRRGQAFHAYLADFGIARQLGRDQALTVAGAPVGTPGFMAPEVHTGGTAGPSSDLYSLGCLLWVTLTGLPAYAAPSDYELIRAHVESPVPQLAPDGPAVEELNRILRRALAKRPEDRYPDAATMRADLVAAAGLPGPVRPVVGATRLSGSTPGSRRPPRRRWYAVAVLVAALLATGGYLAVDRPPDERRDQSAPAADGLTQADRQRARDTMAAVIAATLPRDVVDADCVAEEWIARSGLEVLIAEGHYDAALDFIDLEEAQMSRRTRADALGAVAACRRD